MHETLKELTPGPLAGTPQGMAFPDGFLDCAADVQASVWYWPDVRRSSVWFAGPMLPWLGYPERMLVPDIKSYLSLMHVDDREHVERSFRTVIERQHPCTCETEYRLRRADGSHAWVRGLVSFTRQRDGDSLCALGITRILDSARQLDNPVLTLTEDALHKVLNEIGHPVVLMTADGVVVQANAATARVVGESMGPLAQMRYCPFLHESDGSTIMPGFLGEVVRTGELDDRELLRFERWWHMYLVPLRDSHHEVRRVLLLAQDITAIKVEQAAQLAREKALTRTLVREVHHRIKNHLQGLVGLLRSYASSAQSPSEMIDAAVAQILTIATVHGLLAKNGQTTIDFSTLVEQIVATCRVNSPLPIHFLIDSQTWQPKALSQEQAVPLAVAIGELLTNAGKHTPKVPEARVEATLLRTGADIEFRIRNTPARLPELFGLSSSAGLHSGLDLVKALLSHGAAQLEIYQLEESVIARLRVSCGGDSPHSGP